MTRGVAPLVLGFRSSTGIEDRRRHPEQGRDGAAGEQSPPGIERYTDIPVLGALPRDSGLRHRGAASRADDADGNAGTSREASRGWRLRSRPASTSTACSKSRQGAAACRSACSRPPRRRQIVRIAVARDSAFGFYYADDLEAFERAGAKLCFFDALSDSQLPGCGRPLHRRRLPGNAGRRAGSQRLAARRYRAKDPRGLPAYAECGGHDVSRPLHPLGACRLEMAGVIPADAVMHDRPQGRGLVLLEETAIALALR